MKLLTYTYAGNEAVGVLKNDGSEVVPVNYLGWGVADMNEFLSCATPEKLEKLDRNRGLIWGVSFQNNGRRHTDTLTMTIQAANPEENYIVDRLKREGRGGAVTQTAPGVYTYETRVFDCNEMLPWLRTFTGRILSLTCSDPFVERLFYQDLQTMYQLYQINGGGPGSRA